MPRNINIVVLWMLKYDGSGFLTGGLERWCRDLGLLLRSKGYTVTIYQKATVAFEREIEPQLNVVGIKCPLTIRGNWSISRWLEKNVSHDIPTIFVSQELNLSDRINRAACINHGIWWDGDMPWWKRSLNKRLQYKLLFRSLGVICVDTNYINWCHAELPNRLLWEQKLHYIPNYANLELFPVSASRPKSEDLTILFPRRIMGNNLDRHDRGAGFFLKAVDVLLKQQVKVRLMFAGRGELQPQILEWASSRGLTGRIEIFETGLDEMANIYNRCDVVVVPSLAHEGTSLSAIEAIAAGVPTVVSHIGGLGNIVIPGLNGHICDLNPASLAAMILQAHQSPCLKNPTVLNAVRESLGKERWDHAVWLYLSKILEL